MIPIQTLRRIRWRRATGATGAAPLGNKRLGPRPAPGHPAATRPAPRRPGAYRPTWEVRFEPRDLWVGVFWDRRLDGFHVYVCPLPTLVIHWWRAK